MKRIAAIILLICLVAPPGGTYLYIYLKKISLKKEVAKIINNQLDENDVVILRFTEEEKNIVLEWKHEGEFEYAGHMYDIVDQGIDGNTTWYKCYRDHKETRLNLEKRKLVARALNQDPKNKTQNNQIKIFFSNILNHEQFSWDSENFACSEKCFSILTFHFDPVELVPDSPPPKLTS